MNRAFRRSRVVVVLFMLIGASVGGIAGVSAKQSATPSYTLTELGEVKNLPASQLFGINNDGTVVGVAYDPSQFVSRAAIATNGKIRAMVKGEKGSSVAYGINSTGQVIGERTPEDSSSYSVATFWDGSQETVLVESANNYARALAINDDGVVVGYRTISESELYGAAQAFVWADGEIEELAPLPTGQLTMAYGINNNGDIVGTASEDYDDVEQTWTDRAVIWQDGEITALDSLGGDHAFAMAINDEGQIVGLSTTKPGQSLYFEGTHAVLWDGDTTTDLGLLATGTLSGANAINSEGQVVGWADIAQDDGFAKRATTWIDGEIIDLNDVVTDLPEGWVLETTADINDAGQIVGTASVNGVQTGYLLTPEKSGDD